MCDINDYALDPASVSKETWRTARKEHVCSCCGGAVKPGEKYLVNFSVFEGSAATEKSCLPCWAATQMFAKEHHGVYGTPATMPGLIQDCIEDAEDEEEAARWEAVRASMHERRAARTTTATAP